MLYRGGERIAHGHAGAMPGFLSSVMAHAKDGQRVGAVVLANATAGVDVEALAGALIDSALEFGPPPPAWAPGDPPPEDVQGLLGRWWSEGSEYVFSWRDGRLEARAAFERELRAERPAVFEPSGPGRWRTASGREQGEELRAIRDEDGKVRAHVLGHLSLDPQA
jgi:hypothetical protein